MNQNMPSTAKKQLKIRWARTAKLFGKIAARDSLEFLDKQKTEALSERHNTCFY
jgi:hypothetical protein